jgi:predicted nucleic acid-binding protein
MTVFDTDVLIDAIHLQAIATQSLEYFSRAGGIGISTMTEMEIVVGARNKAELRATHQFLQRFTILPISVEISHKASEILSRYTLSHGLKTPDAFIAATALHHALPLLSKNQRDYRFITGLNLLPYPPRTQLL